MKSTESVQIRSCFRNPLLNLHLIFCTVFVCSYPVLAVVDTFGITQLYPTKAGTRSWTSAHWNNGIPRTVNYSSDQYDPTDWTEDHSSSTDGFRIDGKGTMTMSGGGPRFHINSMDGSKVGAQFFCDVEFTAYYQRRGTSGQNYAGMVMGVRSGPLGHGSSGGNDCDATTYYARFRNDGKWDFEKELKHPASAYWSGSGYNKQDPLWHGAKLPVNRWIGMKYIVYNEKNDTRVHLELYIDSVSNGTTTGGGNWELVGTVTDSGTWAAGDVSGCDYQQNAVILEGHGTMLMRTDGDTAVYKMVSIREIEPLKTGSVRRAAAGFAQGAAGVSLRSALPDGNLAIAGPAGGNACYAVYTLQGELLTKGILAAGTVSKVIRPGVRGEGVYLVRMSPARR